VDDLNAAFERHGVPAGIHHFGSIFFLKFPAEYHSAPLFYYLMRERGIHIPEGFPAFLTTAHDDADFAKIVEATIARWIGHYQTLLEVIAGDNGPGGPAAADPDSCGRRTLSTQPSWGRIIRSRNSPFTN
jgi:hypothetical protein